MPKTGFHSLPERSKVSVQICPWGMHFHNTNLSHLLDHSQPLFLLKMTFYWNVWHIIITFILKNWNRHRSNPLYFPPISLHLLSVSTKSTSLFLVLHLLFWFANYLNFSYKKNHTIFNLLYLIYFIYYYGLIFLQMSQICLSVWMSSTPLYVNITFFLSIHVLVGI